MKAGLRFSVCKDSGTSLASNTQISFLDWVFNAKIVPESCTC